MKQEFQLCIIIPAFNEANKLELTSYKQFLGAHSQVAILFVNDASNDDTLSILEGIKNEYPTQVNIITNTSNKGKAESVRAGINGAFDLLHAPKYAFLDADLATTLQECYDISQTVKDNVELSFGSRILTLDSKIERKPYRHYIGRIVATAISNTLKLEIYDTQCGCKIFTDELSKKIFQEPFISKWLFDVELFFRAIAVFGRKEVQHKIHEHPLKQWTDKGESKVKFSYFFKLWVDLWKIRSQYKGV